MYLFFSKLMFYIIALMVKKGKFLAVLNFSLFLFITIAGSVYVKPSNWSDFAPKGFSGIMFGTNIN